MINAYNDTDRQLHWFCQTITKVNRAFVPQKQDDSHTNLYFDAFGKNIFGRWFKNENRKYILALDLENQLFKLLNDNGITEFSQPIIGSTIQEIESQLKNKMDDKKFNTSKLLAPLHYKIPGYTFTKEVINRIPPEDLLQWMEYRALANYVCFDFLGNVQVAAEIRIWPHHFDTGIYFEQNSNIGIGFGLAMKDEIVGNPYFYISAYPKDYKINYKKMPVIENAKWVILENWQGCVLNLERIQHLKPSAQYQSISSYLLSAYKELLIR